MSAPDVTGGEQRDKLSVKEAVAAAMKYVRDLYDPDEVQYLRLEEVQLSDDEKIWDVTVSWVEPAVSRSIHGIAPLNYSVEKLPRVYKDLVIDARSGQVLRMKMRGTR